MLALTDLDDAASQAVAARLGMRDEGTTDRWFGLDLAPVPHDHHRRGLTRGRSQSPWPFPFPLPWPFPLPSSCPCPLPLSRPCPWPWTGLTVSVSGTTLTDSRRATGLAAVWRLAGLQVGTELFPQIDSGEFVLRFRPPPGSNFELTRQMAIKCLEEIEREAKPEHMKITMGYVGQVAPNFGIDNMVLFMRGPDDGQLRVVLTRTAGSSSTSSASGCARSCPSG